ncbi:hypothetical protein ACHAQJ_005524 [Trichoderma viride]
MKVSALFSAVAALAGPAAAFYGQLAAGTLAVTGEGPASQPVYLTDYNTGSTYAGRLTFGFSATENSVQFDETSAGGYDFYALLWKTSDGCHNIDFQGALGAGHGWCCGSLPCDLTA